ncbi:hypothetical protein PsorP6_006582 [Peronosclerospora sorghi]|uniref:Uncharacterized protein n=1 Tax=Peronosclerospora sorghi TaxID=230839 RepID=A0ACC0W6C1_9STRA|nr:hypothetical protein PsorP6_006582 [Peronosclerospora sorghi]
MLGCMCWQTLASFLDKNFLEKRWTDAAMKNAYSLLSKKKYQVAASFFLLCEPPRIQDAVRVLSVRLGDPSLALVISRLVEFQVDTKPQDAFTLSETGITPAGPVTKQLVENDVLPLFHQKHDVWLQSCAYWWLEDFNQAWAVLLPQFQDVDVCNHSTLTLDQNELVSSVVQATHFYINLTSLTLYFQHLHSNDNSPLVRWAKAKMHRQVYPDAPASPTLACSGNKRLQLASTIDIEHGFSFAAYVCKRNGLNDTALVEMLQARHLIDLHARFEIPTLEPSIDALNNPIAEDNSNSLFDSPTSPRFRSSLASWKRENKLSCCAFVRSPRQATWSPSQKQQSYSKEFFFPQKESQVTDKKTPLCQASELQFDRSIPTALWQQAQIADIECRRWASSAFVGKMIGILVARGMISHFRAELSMWFQPGTDNDAAAQNGPVRTTQEQQYHDRTKLHKAFLNELCNPLCQQFQLDRQYVFEAALAVMHPHAYLHIVEVCFLLSEIGRVSTLRKWLEYVSLSMLHSCSTFASCSIAEDVYRDWESLTIQLCYVVNLNSQGQISIPSRTIAHISVAVRTGIIFLSWARKRSDILREAVTSPFYTVSAASPDDPSATLSSYEFGKSLPLLRSLLKNGASNGQKTRKTQIWEGTLGYTFLGAVAANQADSDHISLLSWGDMKSSASENQLKTRKMYTLILMVSVLRTLHARATAFLSTYEEIRSGDGNPKETDIASSLFTPQKLWKTLSEGPLEGQRRWYTLIESHLRCEFDYSVKVSPCLCGLYGIDTMTFEAAANGTRKQMKCQNDVSRNGVLCSNSGHVNGGSVRGRNAIFPKETTEDMSLNNLQAFLGEIGLSLEQHMALVRASDDYILLLMQNARIGVQTRLRRFRLDPRVYVKSFVVQDAFRWFDLYQIFRCNTRAECYLQVHAFLRRCCKRRKLRLLVTHRGEDTQMFPSDHHYSQRTASRTCIARCASDASDGPPSRAFEVQAHDKDGFVLPEALYLQSMMFVDPWEVEAEYNVRRYMHYGQSPVHVELGWDRLSSICSETCDGIVVSVLQDPDLVTMWKVTGAKGWLVSAITQYRLDGLPSYRTLHQHLKHGLAEQEEPRLPLLVEIYSRSQRNAMFEEVGLPHRFVGVITVELIEARDLVSCSWVGKWSDAYVFLELSHSKDKCRETAQEWSLQTYRSSIGEGGVNPQWSTVDNRFVFRFAIPTHGEHTVSPTRTFHEGGNTVNYGDRREVSRLWNAEVNDQNRAALNALEHLFSSVFSGPPALLQCTVYQKNKILSHEFLGRAKIPLHELTSANPMDCWVPLEDTTSGSLHVKIFLSFQLMCSSMAMHC